MDWSGGPLACWPWKGARNRPGGYGEVRRKARHLVASRVVMELFLGRSLDRSELVCHRCDNPPCCNPLHLFVGSHRDNARHASANGRLRGRVLNDRSVSFIKHASASVGVPADALALSFGVSETQIQNILKGRSWAHVG